MFSSIAPILRWSSPERRCRRRMGRRLNDGLIPPCLDENLKCSVNCCIVCLLIIHSTTMTEQDKITIFDALIKPFLHSDALMHVVKSNATPESPNSHLRCPNCPSPDAAMKQKRGAFRCCRRHNTCET